MLVTLLWILVHLAVEAQPAETDTTIWQVVDEKARFPGCETLDGAAAAKDECATKKMLQYVYQQIRYPQQAVAEGIEGTVVVRFVVEKNGQIGPVEVLKDIGGGCAAEAVRVVLSMNQLPARWMPGRKNGEAGRSYFVLPVKFKIQEPSAPPEFALIGRDTTWLLMDRPPFFEGGPAGLDSFLSSNLIYPESGNADCRCGEVEVQLLVRRDGSVLVTDLLDYSGLGIDYMYEAIAAAHATKGHWLAAEYEDRLVPATVSMRLPFEPTSPTCAKRVAEFHQARQLSAEAAQLYEADQSEAALAKWNEAVSLFPENAEFLSFRGQAYVDLNRMEEACADLSQARQTLWVTWYNQLLPLICGVGRNRNTVEETNE